MATYRVTRTIAPDLKLVFTWEGGTYIDVAQEFDEPVEVINVWDYDTGKPEVPFTKPAMRRCVDMWIAEYPREELVKDVRKNWYG